MLKKIAQNPYLLAVLLLVLEGTTNVITSQIFNKNLGDTNLSFVIVIMLAAYFVAAVLKEPVSSAYTSKFVCTYFGIIFLIGVLASLGTTPTVGNLYVGALFTALLASISYWGFNFFQRKTVALIQKQEAAKNQSQKMP